MALLYGGLVLLVGVSLLFTCVILLQNAIVAPDIKLQGGAQLVDGSGNPTTKEAIAQSQQDAAISYLLKTGGVYFAIIVIIGTTGGYLLAKQALRPIAKLTQTARALSTENLDQRINLGGPDDELRELADTFDEMLGRLDQAFDSQRLFVANASHELRTPLSVIRTELEVTLSDPHADPEAQEKGVRVETEVEEAVTVGDPRLLERLVGNLVENGIRHNVPGGWLRITTGQTSEKVWLHVANGGAVIPNGDVDRLFEPFRRGAGKVRTATKGAGLGLAIVRLIVEAHRGRLQAAAPPFGGLAVRVELPHQRRSQVEVPDQARIDAIA